MPVQILKWKKADKRTPSTVNSRGCNPQLKQGELQDNFSLQNVGIYIYVT